MSYNELLKDIKENELKKVYLCCGNETYLRDWAISEIKKKYIDKSFKTLNLVQLEGKDVKADDIIGACETLPFMSDIKIVIVADSPFVSSSKGGNVKEEEKLINYIKNVNETTCLIFLVDGEKVDKRKKIIKRIKSNGAIIEFTRIKDEKLNKWIDKKFKENNKKISIRNINYFIDNIGYDEMNSNKTLYDLENEVNKICNYVGDKTEIVREDIDSIVTKSLQNNIFELVDAMGRKNVRKALTIFNEMILLNQPVQLIFHMIVRQLRLLLMVKLLQQKGYTLAIIAQKLKLRNFVARKLIEQNKNFTEKRLESELKRCLKIDEDVKRGKIDSKLAIEILIANFI